MTHQVTSVSQLERHIGKTPDVVYLKTIDHLDNGAFRWIDASTMMIAGVGDPTGISMTLAGDKPGWVRTERSVLHLPRHGLEEAPTMRVGASFGSFFMIPSISELLRVNGVVANIAEQVSVAVEECYFHCGKALIRSAFWAAEPVELPTDDSAAFVEASRFLALATIDGHGHADLSPKGDLMGMMACLEDNILWFADRPGNKRVDSFRNIIEQPRVAAVLIVPGMSKVMHVTGLATISSDERIRTKFMVNDNVPALVIGITCDEITFRESPAIRSGALWPAAPAPEGISMASMAAAHIKLNKGLKAKLIGAAMSIPGLVEKELAKDYKNNLF